MDKPDRQKLNLAKKRLRLTIELLREVFDDYLIEVGKFRRHSGIENLTEDDLDYENLLDQLDDMLL